MPKEYADRAPFPLKIAQFFFGGPRRQDLNVPPGIRLARALESFGPAYIKLGQMLATRPDLIGSEIAGALECLQDRLPPFPEGVARAAIETELGRPVDQLFSIFGEAVAAASIAQVHRAMTADEEPRQEAVKVLRPGIEMEFARDLSAFAFAARMAERVSAEARRLRAIALVDTLAASVALELDLRMEAAGLPNWPN